MTDKQEVWLLWSQENIPFPEPPDLEDIYTTEEIAQKHCDRRNREQYDYDLNRWRANNKRPNEFPDFDFKPSWEYTINCWDVNSE